MMQSCRPPGKDLFPKSQPTRITSKEAYLCSRCMHRSNVPCVGARHEWHCFPTWRLYLSRIGGDVGAYQRDLHLVVSLVYRLQHNQNRYSQPRMGFLLPRHGQPAELQTRTSSHHRTMVNEVQAWGIPDQLPW